MKQLPNFITGTRILFSLLLLFVRPFSISFFLFYVLGGVSDMLDGFIARKTGSTSKCGALLDSLADAIFIGVLLILFIPYFTWPLWILFWLGGIALVRLSSLLAGLLRYRKLAFLHTVFNKLTGLLLFCFPLFYWALGLETTAVILCGAATLSALEELYINLTAKTLDTNISSMFNMAK